MSGFTPSALVQWLHGKPLNEGDTSMRSELFIPAQYEVFAGLDVAKRSISVTFTNHQGFIRSLRMPYSVEHLLNHVRKHFPEQKVAFAYEAGPTGYGLDCMMGWWPKPIRA